MVSLLESAPFFLLLSLSLLSLLLSITRLHVFLPIEREDLVRGCLPGIYIAFPLVLSLGWVATLSGVLGLVGISKRENGFLLGHKVLEVFIRVSLGSCLLYLLNPKIIPHLTSDASLPSRTIRIHNYVFSVFMACSGVISLVSLFTPIPVFIPQIVVALTCCFPLPIIVLIGRRQTVFHIRGWLVLFCVQLFGFLSACLASVQNPIFFLVHTIFFILWLGGMMALFQMLCIPVGMELHPAPRVGSPSPSEEDFRSLQDPFMAPPRSPGATSMTFSGVTSTTTTWSDSNQHRSYTHSLTSTPELSCKKTLASTRRHDSVQVEVEDLAKDKQDYLGNDFEVGVEGKRRRSGRAFSEPLLPTLLGEDPERRKPRPDSLQSTRTASSVATVLASEGSRGRTATPAPALAPRTPSPARLTPRPRTPTMAWYLTQSDAAPTVQYAPLQEYLREGILPRNTVPQSPSQGQEPCPMYSPV